MKANRMVLRSMKNKTARWRTPNAEYWNMMDVFTSFLKMQYQNDIQDELPEEIHKEVAGVRSHALIHCILYDLRS